MHDRSIAIRDIVLTDSANVKDIASIEKEIRALQDFYMKAENAMERNFVQKNLLDSEEQHIYKSIYETRQKTMPIIDNIIVMKNQGKTI